MGSSTTNQSSQTTPQPTAQQLQLENQQIGYNNFMMPLAQQAYGNMAGISNAILTGGNLPGQYNQAYGISPAQSQSMVNQAMLSLPTSLQASGALNSGSAVQAAANTGANILNQNAQFNTQALQNLLNIGTGGQSQLQGQMGNLQGQLASSLQAQMPTSTTSNETMYANPYTQAFQGMQALGSLSGGIGGFGTGMKALFCWVAAEIFGGWSIPETRYARFYMIFHSPRWLRFFYARHGARIAQFIKNKPILRIMLKPLFLLFSKIGKEKLNGR